MRALLICLLLFILAVCGYGQSTRIEGVVYDRSSKQAMSYATVQLKSTTTGTTTNIQGRFTLDLPKGEHVLLVSYIGFRTQEVIVKLPDAHRSLEIFLEPLSIILPEIVIGSNDEDPAYKIIRRAIRNKNENRKNLNSLEYNEYRKSIFKSAGQIASIEESFLKGFKAGDEEKDYVLSTFKTENIKKDNKSIAGFKNNKFDFYKDTLDIIGNKVHLPLSVDAFDYYDYKLLNTKPTESRLVYFIEVIPRSEIRPLLKGMVLIEDSSFALAGLELKSNGMTVPFITDLNIRFTERKVKLGEVWFPQYLESRISLGVSLGGLLSVENMDLEQFRSFSNQKINYSGIDTTLNSHKTVILTKGETDLLRPVPLNDNEIAAYRDLDSTKKPMTLIKTAGVLSNFVDTQENSKKNSDTFWGKTAEAAEVLFNYLSFKNNRVGGIGLGVYYDGGHDSSMIYGASGLYSIGLKKPEGNGYAGFRLGGKRGLFVRADIFSHVKRWNENSQFTEVMNSVSVTLGLEDNFNYMRSQGFKVSIEKGKADSMTARVGFVSERQTSVTEIVNHRIFSSRFARRDNPAIKEGLDNRLTLDLTYGSDPLDFQFMPQSGFSVLADLSLKELGGDFGYLKLYSIWQLRFKTIFRELFFPPFMLIRLEGGSVNGNYGLQHMLTPESALAFVSPFGVFKGLKPYDYTGDKMAALHIEHNWRGIIFQSIGLKSLSERNYGIATGLSVLKVWNSSDIMNKTDIIKTKGNIPVYWEVYGGVTGIFGLLRLDGAYTSNEIFVARAGFTLSL